MTPAGELVPFDPGMKWEDGEKWEAFQARLGFSATRQGYMGDEHLERLEWFRRVSGEGHEYLAAWGDSEDLRHVFLRDWPALIKLRGMAAPLIQAQELEVKLGGLVDLAEKAFRAWHRHAPEGNCPECNPQGAKRDAGMRARAERLANGND